MELTFIYPKETSMSIITCAEKLSNALEEVFERLQIVHGTELPAKLSIRSMMVGDLVHKADENRWFLCDIEGWREITSDFARKWKFLPRRDRVMGYSFVKEYNLC